MTTYYLLLEDGFGQFNRREIFQKYWIEECFILLLWTFISSQRDIETSAHELVIRFPYYRWSFYSQKERDNSQIVLTFRSDHQAEIYTVQW